MDGSGDYQAKQNKPDKDKYHRISLTCEIWKKKDTNELIYKTEKSSQRKKIHLGLIKGKGKDKYRNLGLTDTYYIQNKQKGTIV